MTAPMQSQKSSTSVEQVRREQLRRRANGRGFVTARDLADTYPIAEMSGADLARVMSWLEGAGIEVELDLLSSSCSQAQQPQDPQDSIQTKDTASSEMGRSMAAPAKASKPYMFEETGNWLPTLVVATTVILSVIVILAFI